MHRSTLAFLCVLGFSTSAAADGLRDAERLSVSAGVSFGGRFAVDIDFMRPVPGPTTMNAFDLHSGPEIGVRFTHPLHAFITLAGEFRATRWRSENFAKSSTLFDVTLLPAARHVFDSERVDVEWSVGVPFGLTVNMFRADLGQALARGQPGFHIGLLSGLAFSFVNGLGFALELGWLQHRAFDVDGDFPQYRMMWNQATARLLGSYAF